MLATLLLRPGSRVEWALLVALAALAAMLAWVVRRTTTPLVRHGLLLAAYLAGSAALGLVGHALAGVRVFELSPYALMLATSVLVAWSLVVPRLLSIGLPSSLVFKMIFGCLVLGVLGSRLANVLDGLRGGLDALPSRLADRGSGLGVFGAVIVDTAFLVVLFRRHPQHSVAAALDASTTAIGVNVGLGRVGCLLAGCCYGAATEPGLFTLSVRAFQPGSPAGLAYAASPDAHVWATQPMEAALVLSLTLGCELLYRKRAALGLRDGAVIATLALGYGAGRAALEGLRADSPRSVLGVFTSWQVLGAALALGAGLWLVSPKLRPAAR